MHLCQRIPSESRFPLIRRNTLMSIIHATFATNSGQLLLVSANSRAHSLILGANSWT